MSHCYHKNSIYIQFQTKNIRGDNLVSRRSSRFDHTLTTFVTNKANSNGKNGSMTSPDKTKLNPDEESPETTNLITIEAKEDMIKVESY